MVLFSVLLPSFSHAGVDEPFLESVDGRDFVRLERGGESLEMYPGDYLEVGDVIDSGNGGCRIVLPGLSEISVSENTKVQWLGSVSGAPQFNVSEGMIWARVVKSDPAPTPPPAYGETPNDKFKFTLRTRAAVLGVRGTEFTVLYRNDKSEFSTLEGEVTIAKDEASLRTGKGIERALTEDRVIWGVNGAPARDHFKTQLFREQLQNGHPRAFRMRHQVRRTIRELRQFQKNLKRVGEGQTTTKFRKNRTVLELPEEAVDQVDAKSGRMPSPEERKAAKQEARQQFREERRKARHPVQESSGGGSSNDSPRRMNHPRHRGPGVSSGESGQIPPAGRHQAGNVPPPSGGGQQPGPGQLPPPPGGQQPPPPPPPGGGSGGGPGPNQ